MLNTDERGFTLVELLVAMTIMLLVVGALLTALESGTRTERVASLRIDDAQSARLVVAQLTHDVRAATAVLPGTSYPDELDLQTGGTHVRWTFMDGALSRATVDDTTGAATGGVSVQALANTPTTPALTFAAADGTDLAGVIGITPGDLQHCTSTVLVNLIVGAHPPSKPFSETGTAVLRNQPDLAGCP